MNAQRPLFCVVIAIWSVNLCFCVKNNSLTEKQEKDIVKYIRQEINKCEIHDEPTLSQCLKDVAILLKPYMLYGLKTWDVPVLEPLFLKSVKISRNEGGTNLRAHFEDVFIYGLSTYEILYLKTFPSEYRYKFGLHFPHLKIVGNYNMEGKILLLELKDHGPFSANLTNVKVDMVNKFKVKDGLLNMYEVNTEFDIGSIKFHLDNLLKGTQIGESVNEALNADVDELMKELKPAFAEQINKITVRTLQRGMQNLPLEKWQAAIR